MERVLVTGAGGFVGRALVAALPRAPDRLSLGAPDWEARLEAARFEGAVVFHLAARVHDPRTRDAAAYERDNVEKSRRLAAAAASGGARRLVFLSSIKVHGEETTRPFGPADPPRPGDAYARSKAAAERALAEVAGRSGLPLAIVRSPLVFGPGARGNVESVVRLADTPWPLPFGAIANRRSFIHVDDLARLLLACGSHPDAPGATFIGAHSQPLSTPALIAALRRALGRPERLFPVAPALLEAAAAALGAGERMRRLTRSLEADPEAAHRVLGWKAAIGLGGASASLASAWRAGWR